MDEYNNRIKIIRHRVKGGLYARDLIAPAQQVSKEENPVLWDFTEAMLVESDLKYGVFLKSISESQGEAVAEIRRAFLVPDDRMRARLSQILSEASPTWPWRIFVDESEAIAWLST